MKRGPRDHWWLQRGRGIATPDVVSLIIIVVFFGLAAWFMWGPAPLDRAAREVIATSLSDLENVDAVHVKVRPKRQRLTDPPIILINGFERDCQSCHRLFDSQPETARKLTQHTHIVLDHGLNDRCFNCHDRENRNRLVLYSDKNTIGYDEVERLCAKCHGPTYRDWERGVHGRTDGYWDTSKGEANQLICTECHNPHEPAFPAYDPLDPPNTLRVAPTEVVHEAVAEVERAKVNPLRRWELQKSHEDSDHAPDQDHRDDESHGYDESSSDHEEDAGGDG